MRHGVDTPRLGVPACRVPTLDVSRLRVLNCDCLIYSLGQSARLVCIGNAEDLVDEIHQSMIRSLRAKLAWGLNIYQYIMEG